MNEAFTRHTQDMLNAAKDARIPENVQAIAEEGVARTREAYDKLSSAAKDGAKVTEEVMLAVHAGAKALGEKVLDNATSNTEAAFDAAQAIARAKTVAEAAQLQAIYFQKQLQATGAQTKELFELSTRIAKQTFDSMSAAATKTFEQMKKTG